VRGYGYRSCEIDKKIKKIQRIKIKLNAKQLRNFCDTTREPMIESRGGHIKGCAQPHADLKSAQNYLAGAMSRVCVEKFRPSRQTLRSVRRLATHWARQFPKIRADHDFSVETWIANTSYTAGRKEEILKAWRDVDCKNYVNSFLKDEQYSKYTHARTINARRDYYKALFGPFIHGLEECVFSHPSFVKRVPVSKRFAHLKAQLYVPGRTVQWTDHTCYESVFTPQFVEAAIMPVYDAVMGDHPRREEFLANYREFVISPEGHELRSSFMTLLGVQTECSGEMDTSFKNGVGNKLGGDVSNALTDALETSLTHNTILTMLTEKLVEAELEKLEVAHSVQPMASYSKPGLANSLPGQAYSSVCEGDDGVCSGRVKTWSGAYAFLGFDVKMVEGATLEEGNFCSVDGSLMAAVNATDPIAVLSKFPWLSGQHLNLRTSRKMELLKARAMSLLAMYPECPILTAYGQYILRCTTSVDVRGVLLRRYVGRWVGDKFKEVIEKWDALRLAIQTPNIHVRRVVESRYGILIPHQIEVETYLNSLTTLQELDHPLLRIYVPVVNVDYYARYCTRVIETKNPHKRISYQMPTPTILRRFDNWGPALRKQLLEMGLSCHVD